ncbi:hypothetical protein [Herbiconiux daphne]|uniref:Uncharacterized protein n=1 Tax=Herbiconiux daphne TaxID=2970914 RepID=A0ABT2H935_9MICO|nr:hypothetical protein [Herbiconiux daphne]MCS5736458.1 hypothetical protein [Herbiconiux daphne]
MDATTANQNGGIDKDEDLVFEFELSIEGKNPKIEIDAVLADSVKITTYDAGHNSIYEDLVVETEYKFNNNNVKTTIQL